MPHSSTGAPGNAWHTSRLPASQGPAPLEKLSSRHKEVQHHEGVLPEATHATWISTLEVLRGAHRLEELADRDIRQDVEPHEGGAVGENYEKNLQRHTKRTTHKRPSKSLPPPSLPFTAHMFERASGKFSRHALPHATCASTTSVWQGTLTSANVTSLVALTVPSVRSHHHQTRSKHFL